MSDAPHRSPWAQENYAEDDNLDATPPMALPAYDPLDEPLTPGPPVARPTAFDPVFWFYATIAAIAIYTFYRYMVAQYYIHKEKQEMLERRRRAGIPDEDKRPFNIAYNAAALARRERDDERRKREAAEAAAASPPESDWRQLGRTLGIPQDRPPIPYGSPGTLLNHRFPHLAQQPQRDFAPLGFSTSVPTFPRANPNIVQTRATYAVPHPIQNDSPTISSSDSPPHPVPPSWQDQYAPPEIKAANAVRRQNVGPLPSALGRRSRKQLVLDDASESDNAPPSRSRLRRETWGKEMAIDGDDEAKWVEGYQPVRTNNLRIRKREDDDEDEDDEDVDSRAKSKRKVDSAPRTMPGGLPSSGLAGAGKRKDRDEEDSAQESVKPQKQKKRVRVVSVQGSQEPADQDMQTEEGEKVRESSNHRAGEEWVVEGVRHKMSDNGVELMEAFFKEQKSILKNGTQSSPSKKVVATTVTKRWMTPDAYAKAEKAGSLTKEFDVEQIIAEIHTPPRAGSNEASDWGSIVGQTPLRTGGLKTGLGTDRTAPPFSSLPQANKLPIEQSRLLHMASPRNYGKGRLTRKESSRWEQRKAEESALESIRAARRAAKPAAAVTSASTMPGDAKSAVPAIPTFSFKPTAESAAKPAVSTPVLPSGPPEAPKSSNFTTVPQPVKAVDSPKPEEKKPETVKESKVPEAGSIPAAKAPEAPKPSFPFGIPVVPAATAASAPNPSMNSEKPSSSTLFSGFKPAEPPKPSTPFSFGAPASMSNTAAAKPLFGATAPSDNAPKASVAPAPPVPTPTVAAAAAPFSLFGAASTPAVSSAPVANQASAAPSASTTTAPTPLFGAPAAPAPPKPTFSFSSGFGGKPATSTSTPASGAAPTTSTLFGGSAPTSTTPSATTPAVTAPTFSFGAAGAQKPAATAFSFGSSVAPSAPAPAPAPATTGVPTFGGFAAASTSAPATSAETKPAAPTFSIFGAASKATEPPKQDAQKPFSFGAPAATPSFGAAAGPTPTMSSFGGPASSQPFSFGGTGGTTAFGAPSGGLTFGVGGTGTSSTSTLGQASATPSSPFAFGTPQASNGTALAPPPTADASQTPTTPVFNLGTPPLQNRAAKPLPNRARR